MDSSESSACEVFLLGSFGFAVDGELRRDLPPGSERLLAFLALRDRSMNRNAISGALWPEASEEHAHASLRSALSRLSATTRMVVRVASHEVQLAERVSVDLRDARMLAHRLLDPGVTSAGDLNDRAVTLLSSDLLPDWYDDWAVAEAESWRQLRLHALDALAERLTAAGRFGDATSAALAAVKAEPLRETAHAALIRVYIAEGNRAEALDAFERYRLMLLADLGLEPTSRLHDLIHEIERP
jgi:DNA-binding SARP family transcriptional activator